MNKPALTQKELNLWTQACRDNNEAVFNKYCDKAYRHDITDTTYYYFAVDAYGHTLYHSNKVLFSKLFEIMKTQPQEEVYYTQKLARNLLSNKWIFDFIKDIPTDLRFTENIASTHLYLLNHSPIAQEATDWILEHSQDWQIDQCLNECTRQDYDHFEKIVPYAKTASKVSFLFNHPLAQSQVDFLVNSIGLQTLNEYKANLIKANKPTFEKVIAQLEQMNLLESISEHLDEASNKRKAKI